MDKIDIDEFEQCICWRWICNCSTTNIEVTNPEEVEAVFCQECGETFEIEK